ncbi:hypothetical protein ABIE44_001267 [Marmoricola sp. OAE513]|uniref:hypothetical protein n=1 Tax=Marmoricola sp. OAE513 TaxID=2817894 RepID=UPI001AEA8142
MSTTIDRQKEAPDAPDLMFASKSLREHWIRGALGLVLAIAGFGLIGVVGPVSLLLVLGAGIAWRGCVSCWALGLSQTRAACQVRR